MIGTGDILFLWIGFRGVGGGGGGQFSQDI